MLHIFIIYFSELQKGKMKQLIIVLVVHCLVYTSYGSTQIKKLYADHLIDTVPDSPRGSINDKDPRFRPNNQRITIM